MASKGENDLKAELIEMGFFVVRAAGSLGEGDLALRNKHNQFISVEQKSTFPDAFQVSNTREQVEQFEALKENYYERNIPTVYTVRWKKYTPHHGSAEIRKHEVFLLSEEDRFITRSNQKYPVFKVEKGIPAIDIFPELFNSRNPIDLLEVYR